MDETKPPLTARLAALVDKAKKGDCGCARRRQWIKDRLGAGKVTK